MLDRGGRHGPSLGQEAAGDAGHAGRHRLGLARARFRHPLDVRGGAQAIWAQIVRPRRSSLNCRPTKRCGRRSRPAITPPRFPIWSSHLRSRPRHCIAFGSICRGGHSSCSHHKERHPSQAEKALLRSFDVGLNFRHPESGRWPRSAAKQLEQEEGRVLRLGLQFRHRRSPGALRSSGVPNGEPAPASQPWRSTPRRPPGRRWLCGADAPAGRGSRRVCR